MISFKGVSKTYKKGERGEVLALDGIDLEVNRGEFVFVVGPSGSGKSTFMKLLTREILPDLGEIHVAGKNLVTLKRWKVPALRREIGYVFQDFKLLSNKTVYENVAFALEVIGSPGSMIHDRVPEVLELVVRLALDPESVRGDGRRVNALSEALRRRQRRKLRKQLGETPADEVCDLDFEAWRVELRALAAAQALAECGCSLRTALLSLAREESPPLDGELRDEANVAAPVGESAVANALLRKIVADWLAEI